MSMSEQMELMENELAFDTQEMKQHLKEMMWWAMYQDACAEMNDMSFGIDVSTYPQPPMWMQQPNPYTTQKDDEDATVNMDDEQGTQVLNDENGVDECQGGAMG
uniref:Uncharacterized protein n=1 Tax=Cannabis sativa TaxID=3483 RepID=A0A803Q6W9_CANSA